MSNENMRNYATHLSAIPFSLLNGITRAYSSHKDKCLFLYTALSCLNVHVLAVCLFLYFEVPYFVRIFFLRCYI